MYVLRKMLDLWSFRLGNSSLCVESEIIDTTAPVSTSMVSVFPSTSMVTLMGVGEVVEAGDDSLNMYNPSSLGVGEASCCTTLVRCGWPGHRL